MLPFAMPPIRPGGPEPSWNGQAFVIDGSVERVLIYDAGPSGWNDDLTHLHEEETAGGSHFIDVASRSRAIAAIRRHLTVRKPTLVEVGVSGGHFLSDLRQHFPDACIIGSDYTANTLESIAPSFEGIPLVRMDLTHSPFPDSMADAIVLLNVLEHIERDDIALAECFRMLKPGGILVVEVPAGPGLFDDYDAELLHFRRYRLPGLVQLSKATGFECLARSHIGFFLYPPFWLSKKRSRLRGSNRATSAQSSRVRNAIRASSRFGAVGTALMGAEAFANRFVSLPVGIRCTVTLRKPVEKS